MITLKEHNVKPYGELCAMLAKEQKCAYVAATGTGKSYVVGKYIEDREAASSTLILVPSTEIKHNWEKLIPGVSVTTYQTLCRNKTRADGKKLIVCDEMHHLGAKKWGKVYRERVLENEMFKDMTKDTVKCHASSRGVKSSANKSVPWTAEEEEILMEYIRMPEEERPPIYELAERIPRHSYHGVRHHRRKLEIEMKRKNK